MLPELHRAMDGRGRIIGIDTSTDMLAAAAGRTRGLGTVELIESSAEALPLPAQCADGIVSVQGLNTSPTCPPRWRDAPRS